MVGERLSRGGENRTLTLDLIESEYETQILMMRIPETIKIL
jgi:hypothetical protein